MIIGRINKELTFFLNDESELDFYITNIVVAIKLAHGTSQWQGDT